VKAVIAASFPNEFAAEFTRLISRFDELHTGRTFEIVADAALPPDLRPTFARLASRSLTRASSTATQVRKRLKPPAFPSPSLATAAAQH
jgi:hypothetical protein